MAGLASLTASYSDSEDEEVEHPKAGDAGAAVVDRETAKSKSPDSDAGETSGDSAKRVPSLADRVRSREHSATPASATNSARSTPTKSKKRLVSYGEDNPEEEDDEKATDDEERDGMDGKKVEGQEERDDVDVVPMDLDSGSEGDVDGQPSNQPSGVRVEGRDSLGISAENEGTEKESNHDQRVAKHSTVHVDAWTGEAQLPPEPPGSCDPDLQKLMTNLYRQRVEYGRDINAEIQKSKSFRNPSIYEKLIEYCDIDETGTNFPKELYDGHLFGPESFYDELAKVQAADMERREKTAKGQKKPEQRVSASGFKTATYKYP